ncbi:hypothetical protein ACF3NF_07265 [Anaerococcus martiniensis]|uniref:hypothetical protein n=1 Tax=Anaerococcus sp. WGS1579 TaxID=3366809 RepID=UPI00372D0B4E
MNVEIRMIDDVKEKESIAREVLYDLPEWFGMPESTESYIRDSKDMPHLAVGFSEANRIICFKKDI